MVDNYPSESEGEAWLSIPFYRGCSEWTNQIAQKEVDKSLINLQVILVTNSHGYVHQLSVYIPPSIGQ